MKAGSKESNLVLAALSYAADCVAEGDVEGLSAMGLGIPESELLCSLTLEELRQAGRLCAHALEVRIDPEVLRAAVRGARAACRFEALQRSLVAAGASRDMMSVLFGMGSREFSRLRRLFAVEAGVGRPADLDEAAELRLWQALSGRLRADPDCPLEPEEVLRIHKETGVPARAIWKHAQRWAAEGHDSQV